MAQKTRAFFITGTDTGVGKTLVAAALLHQLRASGLRVAGMKPVASGARASAEGMVSDDALTLMAEASERASYRFVNPYAFEPGIAPHVAATEAGTNIELDELKRAYAILAGLADVVVIEGAGGWLTPLNEKHTLADFAAAVRAKVILVVGLRLGCLNHALLTAQAVEAAGLTLAGWVGNSIDPKFERPSDNVRTLEQRLKAPFLGTIPHNANITVARAAELIQLQGLGLAPARKREK